MAMFIKTFNEVVRLALASTPHELGEALAPMPHGVKYGIACDLEDAGQAHRYDSPRECAYYLNRHHQGVLVWRWKYIATYEEAGKLLAMAISLGNRLNAETASRIFSRATRRQVNLPIPPLDIGPNPLI